MTSDPDCLGLRYRKETLRDSRAHCPAPGNVADTLARTSSRRAREELADHAGDCVHCAAELRVALSLGSWARRNARNLAAGRTRGWRGRLLYGRPWISLAELFETSWLAPILAAALVMAAVLAPVLWSMRHTSPASSPILRGPVPAATNLTPEPDAHLVTPPHRFTWKAQPGYRYHLVLYDEESIPLWTSPTVENDTVNLPEPVRQSLSRGGIYYWRLFSEHELKRTQSALERLTIAPPPGSSTTR